MKREKKIVSFSIHRKSPEKGFDSKFPILMVRFANECDKFNGCFVLITQADMKTGEHFKQKINIKASRFSLT